MSKNYLKIAIRHLQQHKGYMIINIMGLTLGMTCQILIFSVVKHHLSFDNFHRNPDRICRFVTEQHRDNIDYVASIPNPFGKAFSGHHHSDCIIDCKLQGGESGVSEPCTAPEK